MDKLSFASVYRTAAILAAFSHVDALRDEPIGQEGSAVTSVVVHARPRWRAAMRRVFETACDPFSHRTLAPSPVDPHRLQSAGGRVGPWFSPRPTDGSPRSRAVERLSIVSHFAFCEVPGAQDLRKTP